MKRHLAILAQAHDALRAGRVADCVRAMIEFEAFCRRVAPDPKTLRACREQVKALEKMTQAGIDGVADARQAWLDAVAAASQLNTYDARGTRVAQSGRRHNGPAY